MRGKEGNNSQEYKNECPQQFPSYSSTICWILGKALSPPLEARLWLFVVNLAELPCSHSGLWFLTCSFVKDEGMFIP